MKTPLISIGVGIKEWIECLINLPTFQREVKGDIAALRKIVLCQERQVLELAQLLKQCRLQVQDGNKSARAMQKEMDCLEQAVVNLDVALTSIIEANETGAMHESAIRLRRTLRNNVTRTRTALQRSA